MNGWIDGMINMDGCDIWFNGITDEAGNPIGDICKVNNIKPVIPVCSFPDIKKQRWEMKKALPG